MKHSVAQSMASYAETSLQSQPTPNLQKMPNCQTSTHVVALARCRTGRPFTILVSVRRLCCADEPNDHIYIYIVFYVFYLSTCCFMCLTSGLVIQTSQDFSYEYKTQQNDNVANSFSFVPLPTSMHSVPFLFSLIFQRQLHEVRGTMTQVSVQLTDLYLQMTFTLCHHRKTISATEREMILMNLSRHLTQHYCANCINCSLTNPITTGSIRNGDMWQ